MLVVADLQFLQVHSGLEKKSNKADEGEGKEAAASKGCIPCLEALTVLSLGYITQRRGLCPCSSSGDEKMPCPVPGGLLPVSLGHLAAHAGVGCACSTGKHEASNPALSFGPSHCEKDTEGWKHEQRRARRLEKGLELQSCKEQLLALGLFSTSLDCPCQTSEGT